MALRIKPTPTRFPTSSLYTPVDNTLAFYIKCVPPVGPVVVETCRLGPLEKGFPSKR